MVANKKVFKAISRGRVSEVRSILAAGANPNMRNAIRETPLMLACKNANSVIARLLLDAGARLDDRDKDGNTPLMHAVRDSRNRGLITLFVTLGASVDQRDRFGCTPLMRAAASGSLLNVRELIKHSADPNAVSKNSETALTFAIVWGHPRVVRSLILAGADVNRKDQKGWSPLTYAQFEEKEGIVRLLVQQR
jgi:ankyrin repeat protein